MDAAERAMKVAQAVSEGLNCLAVFMCRPALNKLRGEAPDLLRRWEKEYAPVLREVGPPAAPAARAAFSAALAKVSAISAAGVDLDAPDQLAALRGAIRDLLVAMRFPIHTLPPAEAAVCELHGNACPMLEGGAGG